MRETAKKSTAMVAATAAALLVLTACGKDGSGAADTSAAAHRTDGRQTDRPAGAPPPAVDSKTLTGVGATMSAKVPANARQAVVVYGAGPASADSTVVLFTRSGGMWHRGPSWTAHNGDHGWAVQHHEGDRKSPVGVFTLHDAGGVRADPGSRLPYHRSRSFAPPATWAADSQHVFDYVIAIDYNRVVGTSPNDPARPQGESKGGSIWLHMDDGKGSAACVTLSESGMRYLLRTLDPAAHPVVVMGDTAHLAG